MGYNSFYFGGGGGAGPKGFTGPTGLQGPSGAQGISGVTGASGTQGISGVQGPAGGSGGSTTVTGFNEVNETGRLARQAFTSIGPSIYGFLYNPFPIRDVRDFGASGNNSTNDLNAVRAAATAVNMSGGTLYFPALPTGAYRITITGHPSGQLTNIGNNVFPIIYITGNNTSIFIDNGATINFVPTVARTGNPAPDFYVPFLSIYANNVNVEGGRFNCVNTGLPTFTNAYNGYPFYKNSGININFFDMEISGFPGTNTNIGQNTFLGATTFVRCLFERGTNHGIDNVFQIDNSHVFKYCDFFTSNLASSGRGNWFNINANSKVAHIDDCWFLTYTSASSSPANSFVDSQYSAIFITGRNIYGDCKISDCIFENMGRPNYVSGTNNVKILSNFHGVTSGTLREHDRNENFDIPGLDFNRLGWVVSNCNDIDFELQQCGAIVLSGLPSTGINIHSCNTIMFGIYNSSKNISLKSSIMANPNSTTAYKPPVVISGGNNIVIDNCIMLGRSGVTLLVDNTSNGITGLIVAKTTVRHSVYAPSPSILITGIANGPTDVRFLSNVVYSTGTLITAPMKISRGNNVILAENVFNLIDSTGTTVPSLIIEQTAGSGLLFHNTELGGELTGILLDNVSGWMNIAQHSSRNLFAGTGAFRGAHFLSTGVLFSGTFL